MGKLVAKQLQSFVDKKIVFCEEIKIYWFI